MADDAPASSGASKTPADFLKSIRGKPVIVKLNSGTDYRGEGGGGEGGEQRRRRRRQRWTASARIFSFTRTPSETLT
jgi:hypothetical protein